MGEIKDIKKLGKSQTSRVFEQLQSLEIGKEEFSHPGNMTWFISVKQPDVNKMTVKWGDPGYTVPDKYPSFYQQILSIVQP
jgi:hypothetical protein